MTVGSGSGSGSGSGRSSDAAGASSSYRPTAPATVVITGPTASGKGSLARELARRWGGEIVSMDSMKVYRELDVATAKPSAALREEIPHHLIDIVDPDADFSAGEYLRRLETTLAEIHGRGVPALVCGGTALYLKSFLFGLRAGPTADWQLREELHREADARGLGALHERLEQVDPESAARIDPADRRRIVRALEITLSTGRRASEERGWEAEQPIARPYSVDVFGIEHPRALLYERINRRVDRLVERGLFAEARRLERRSPPLGRSARQTIGYKEVVAGDRLGREEADTTALIQQESRRFAKRQMTWFRKFAIDWICAGSGTSEAWADDVARRLARASR